MAPITQSNKNRIVWIDRLSCLSAQMAICPGPSCPFSFLLYWKGIPLSMYSHLIHSQSYILFPFFCISRHSLYLFFPIQVLSVDMCTKTLLTIHHSFQTSLYIVLLFPLSFHAISKGLPILLFVSLHLPLTPHWTHIWLLRVSHVETTSISLTNAIQF